MHIGGPPSSIFDARRVRKWIMNRIGAAHTDDQSFYHPVVSATTWPLSIHFPVVSATTYGLHVVAGTNAKLTGHFSNSLSTNLKRPAGTRPTSTTDTMSGFVGTVSAYECTKCKKLFVDKPNANRHVTSEKCRHATLAKQECGLVKLADQLPPGTHQHGNGNVNANGNGNGNTVHINQLTIMTGGAAGAGGAGGASGATRTNDYDVVYAGSNEEAILIRDIILNNEGLRRKIRTIENAALAIFEATKGARGPQRLRNAAKTSQRTVLEYTERGIRSSQTTQYCKDTAVAMLDHLHAAFDAVGPWSPVHVREWCEDVHAALTAKKHGGMSYEEAVRLYRDGTSTFYKKVPDHADVASSVLSIASIIPTTARFCQE